MRGTTPTHKFILPFAVSRVAKAKVVYKRGDKVLIRKNTADLTMAGNEISVTLTRGETVAFPDSGAIKIQLEIETTDGKNLKTPVYLKYSDELLDEEELK